MGKKKGTEHTQSIDFGKINLTRVAHNFLMQKHGGTHSVQDTNLLNEYVNYVLDPAKREPKKYKVGVLMVCVNLPYWRYMRPVINDIKQYFLPGHDVEIMMWSDLHTVAEHKKNIAKALDEAQTDQEVVNAFLQAFAVADSLQSVPQNILNAMASQQLRVLNDGKQYVVESGQPFTSGPLKVIAKELLEVDWVANIDCTKFETPSIEWPYPTLMRYHMFLSEEEYLKQFDYLFYIDLDMRIVNTVGDEILGDGLTAAQHPMYALSQNLWAPYEANPESAAYIKQPGRLTITNGQPLFKPLYAAGGVQGGTTPEFIEAMRAMRDGTTADFDRNYVARWNDESHWNRYLFDHPPAVVLDPSYVYPDSMINEYYVKIWGRNFTPRIITLTKPFSTSSEGGAAAAEMMRRM